MKNCKTVNGLLKAIKQNERAILKVYEIHNNDFVKGGKVLNLGENRFTYVSLLEWEVIKNHLEIIK